MSQLAAVAPLIVAGGLLLALFGALVWSWARQPRPRPPHHGWHLWVSAGAVAVLAGWLAFDLVPGFSAPTKPDQGVATIALAPVQVFLAVALWLRVRWGLYVAVGLGALAAIFTGFPALFSPSGDAMEVVQGLTGAVDLAAAVAGVQLLRERAGGVEAAGKMRPA